MDKYSVFSARLVEQYDQAEVKDGEIVTACQQVCPAKAITFGNVNDPSAHVVAVKKNDRNYRVLEEFNTRTRTSYLGKLRNLNPELATGELG